MLLRDFEPDANMNSIDKTSSAELSEAINSMYQWYKNANICYAYLEDITDQDQLFHSDRSIESRWFQRGWTLQELIAPRVVEFYTASWAEIGTKSSLRKKISHETGIDIRILDGQDPSICNVAERMSWAAFRQTTRIEDAAYCLLGLFQVSMPLLYGEGKGAFIRLQQEILRTTDDYSLLARHACLTTDLRTATRVISNLRDETFQTTTVYGNSGPLTTNVGAFHSRYSRQHYGWRYSDLEIDLNSEVEMRRKIPSHAETKVQMERIGAAITSSDLDITPTLSAKGLQIALPLSKIKGPIHLAYLYCKHKSTGKLLCIWLTLTSHEPRRFEIIMFKESNFVFLPAEDSSLFTLSKITIRQNTQPIKQLEYDSLSLKILQCSYTLDVGSMSNNENIAVCGNWGFRAMDLPFVTKITPDVRLLWVAFEALFVMETGARTVTRVLKFGIAGGDHLWCAILDPPAKDEATNITQSSARIETEIVAKVITYSAIPRNRD